MKKLLLIFHASTYSDRQKSSEYSRVINTTDKIPMVVAVQQSKKNKNARKVPLPSHLHPIPKEL